MFNLNAIIANLGDSEESVVKVLERENIKGVRFSSSCCPIANYLKKYRAAVVCVTYSTIYARENFKDADCKIVTPGYIDNFLFNFDNNQYPQLLENS